MVNFVVVLFAFEKRGDRPSSNQEPLMKITALIVDDEQPARDELAFLLQEFHDLEVVGQGKNGLDERQFCVHD